MQDSTYKKKFFNFLELKYYNKKFVYLLFTYLFFEKFHFYPLYFSNFAYI